MRIAKAKKLSNGWVHFQVFYTEMEHIPAAGVHIGRGRLHNKFWMPRWVRDAILSFREHRFAGLTLTEYLMALFTERTQTLDDGTAVAEINSTHAVNKGSK
jgi:hypothetical protein